MTDIRHARRAAESAVSLMSTGTPDLPGLGVPHRIAVVGGGMLGLVAALRLAGAGARVTVFEATDSLGGIAGTAVLGDVRCDRFPHEIVAGDVHLPALLHELGLDHRLQWRRQNRAYVRNGQMHAWSSAADWLRLPDLAYADRARLVMALGRAAFVRRDERLERIGAIDWLRGLTGPGVLAQVLLPLLRNRFGADIDRASAAFVQPVLARMFASRADVGGGLRVAGIAGGLGIVLHALTCRLRDLGVVVNTGTPVRQVVSAGDGVRIVAERMSESRFGDVLITLAPDTAAAVCPQLSPCVARHLHSITMLGAINGQLLLTKRLSEFDVIEHDRESLPFTRIVQTPVGDEADSRVVVHLPGRSTAGSALQAGDRVVLRDAFLDGLAELVPSFDRASVQAMRIARSRRALALTTIDYSDNCLPPMDIGLPGVTMVNVAQIPYGIQGPEDTIGLAERQTKIMIETIRRRRGEAVVAAASSGTIGSMQRPGGDGSAAAMVSRIDPTPESSSATQIGPTFVSTIAEPTDPDDQIPVLSELHLFSSEHPTAIDPTADDPGEFLTSIS